MPSNEESLATGLGTSIYRLEYFTAGDHELIAGGPILDERLAPGDFARAEEAAFLDALRQGLVSDYNPPLGRGRIEPRYDDSGEGSHRIVGFDVVLPLPTGCVHRVTFGAHYF